MPDSRSNPLSRLVSAGFGAGYAPLAAGTVASLAALLVGAVLLSVSPWLLAGAAAAASVGGYAAIVRVRPDGDPGWVVIDEVAGQFLALLGLSGVTWTGCLVAFILFRFFDITKLGPVGWADRQHNAFGIMADDIIAGIVSAVLILALRLIWPHAPL